MPDHLASGPYRVEVGVQTLGQETWWPIAVDGAPAGDVLSLGEVSLTGSE